MCTTPVSLKQQLSKFLPLLLTCQLIQINARVLVLVATVHPESLVLGGHAAPGRVLQAGRVVLGSTVGVGFALVCERERAAEAGLCGG